MLTVIGLATLDWRFALAGLLATPVQVIALHRYLRVSTPLYAKERVAEGARTQQLLDSQGGLETVRAFGLTERHVESVLESSLGAVRLALSADRLATRFFARLNLAEFIGLAAVLAVGFWLTGSGTVSVGATAAAALYFHRLFDPVNTLLGLFGTAQEAAAGWRGWSASRTCRSRRHRQTRPYRSTPSCTSQASTSTTPPTVRCCAPRPGDRRR